MITNHVQFNVMYSVFPCFSVGAAYVYTIKHYLLFDLFMISPLEKFLVPITMKLSCDLCLKNIIVHSRQNK